MAKLVSSVLALVLLFAATAWPQEPAGGGQGGGGAPGGNTGGGNTPGGVGGVGGVNTPGGRPGGRPGQDPTTDPNRQQFPEMMQRPIFISGKVLLDDGSVPQDSVVIERICNGTPRPEGYTDSKGRFSFQLGQNNQVFADASVGNTSNDPFSTSGQGGRGNQGGFGSTGGRGGGMSERDLMGCELRASLAGYRSDVIQLSGRRMMDNPDVGTIILHRLAGVEGFSTSMTTLQAPKDAKKAFDKSRELAKKKKWDEAQKELEKAVTVYPAYAVAWNMLGQLHAQANRPDDARKAFEQSIAADRKFTNPYLPLAQLAANEQKWQDVADITATLLKLNPVEFPNAYFFNAVANYNLQKFDEAEKSARESVKLDTQHRMPKAQHLLGMLLAMRDDYSGAVTHIKGYLEFAPQAPDADQVRKQLADIEKRLQASTPAAQP